MLRAGHQDGAETGENDDFIQLRGMPGDPVAEIHTPRQPRGNAVGLIFDAGKKTPDPSDRDPEHQRQGEQVAGRDAYAAQTLDRFDGNQPADQATDDRLSAQEELRPYPVVLQEEGILEGRQDTTSGESTDHHRTDHPPARAGINHISVLAAEAPIEIKARGVGKALEYPVRMDDQRPQVEVRRKAHAPPRKLRADTLRSLPAMSRKTFARGAASDELMETVTPRQRRPGSGEPPCCLLIGAAVMAVADPLDLSGMLLAERVTGVLPLLDSTPRPFRDGLHIVSEVAVAAAWAVVVGILFLLLYYIVRRGVRFEWAAVIVGAILISLASGVIGSGGALVRLPFEFVFSAAMLVVLARVGLVASIASYLLLFLQIRFPVMWPLTQWYSTTGVIGLGLSLVVVFTVDRIVIRALARPTRS